MALINDIKLRSDISLTNDLAGNDNQTSKRQELFDLLKPVEQEIAYTTEDRSNYKVIDGDTLERDSTEEEFARTGKARQGIRLDFGHEGRSLDTFETKKDWVHEVGSQGEADHKAKMFKQRMAIAGITGQDVADVTDQDVYDRGETARLALVKSLSETKQFELGKFKEGKYRPVADIRLPGSTESLLNKLNNKEDNAAYNSKYNQVQNLKDYVPEATFGDAIQDTAISLLAKGTVGLGEATVGIASLATLGKAGEGLRDLGSIDGIQIGFDPQRTKEFFGQFQSDAFKAAEKNVSEVLHAESEGVFDKIADVSQSIWENPRYLLTGVVPESLPLMFASMGLTGALANKVGLAAVKAEGLTAGLTTAKNGVTILSKGKDAASLAAQAAYRKGVEQASTKLIALGSASEGAMTAGTIADQAQAAGVAYEDYVFPALVGGAVTGAVSGVSGKLFGSLDEGINTLKGASSAKLLKAMFAEGITEELPQSFNESLATKIALDPNKSSLSDLAEKDILDAVGEGTLGAFAGAVTGGGMQVLQDPLGVSKDAVTASKAVANKLGANIPESVLGDLSEGVKAIFTPEDTSPEKTAKQYSELAAKSNDLTDPEQINALFTGMAHGFPTGEMTDEQKIEHTSALNTVSSNLSKAVGTETDLATLERLTNVAKQIVKINSGEIATFNFEEDLLTGNKPENIQTYIRNLGSAPIGENSPKKEDVQKLIDKEVLSPEQSKEAEAYINRLSLSEVATDVLYGERDRFISVDQHNTLIRAGLESGNVDGTKAAIDRYGVWANRHIEKANVLTELAEAATKHGVKSTQAEEALVKAKAWQTKYNPEGKGSVDKTDAIIFYADDAGKMTNFASQVMEEANALEENYGLQADKYASQFGVDKPTLTASTPVQANEPNVQEITTEQEEQEFVTDLDGNTVPVTKTKPSPTRVKNNFNHLASQLNKQNIPMTAEMQSVYSQQMESISTNAELVSTVAEIVKQETTTTTTETLPQNTADNVTTPEERKTSDKQGKTGFKLSVDKKGKDHFKASIANTFIGFGERSTGQYSKDAKKAGIAVNREINPNKDTVTFVSVNGGNRLSPSNEQKTLEQLRRVLYAGGVIVMDNDARAYTSYNKSGEGKIQTALKDEGFIFRASKNGEFNVIKMQQPNTSQTSQNAPDMPPLISDEELTSLLNSQPESNESFSEAAEEALPENITKAIDDGLNALGKEYKPYLERLKTFLVATLKKADLSSFNIKEFLDGITATNPSEISSEIGNLFRKAVGKADLEINARIEPKQVDEAELLGPLTTLSIFPENGKTGSKARQLFNDVFSKENFPTVELEKMWLNESEINPQMLFHLKPLAEESSFIDALGILHEMAEGKYNPNSKPKKTEHLLSHKKLYGIFKPYSLKDSIENSPRYLSVTKDGSKYGLKDEVTFSPVKTLLGSVTDVFNQLEFIPEVTNLVGKNNKDALLALQKIDAEFKEQFKDSIDLSFFKHGTKKEVALGNDERVNRFQQETLKLFTKSVGKTVGNQDPYVDPNVQTAMLLAVLNWLNSNGKDSLEMREELVLETYGYNANEQLPPGALAFRGTAGVPQAVMQNQIGSEIASSLGIHAKAEGNNAVYGKIVTQLGEAGLKVMEQMGYIQVNNISLPDENVFRGIETPKAEMDIINSYVQAVPNKKNTLNMAPKIGELLSTINAGKEAVALLTDNSFEKPRAARKKQITKEDFEKQNGAKKGVKDEDGKTLVEAIKAVYKNTSNTIHQSILGKVFNGTQTEYNFDVENMKIFDALGDEALMQFLGWLDPETVQQHVRESQVGKNRQIERQVEAYNDLKENFSEKEAIYFMHEVVKTGRVQMVGTDSPQADKLMRFAVTPKAWTIKLDPRATDQTEHTWFKLAVLQAYGLKPEELGKSNTKEIDKQFNAVKDAFEKDGHETIQAVLRGEEVDSTELQAILEKGGEGTHSVTGIKALSKYIAANGEAFETNLSVEIDGITNGVLIGLILFAGVNKDNFKEMEPRLNAAGLYVTKDMTFAEWKGRYEGDPTEAKRDNYEQIQDDVDPLLQTFKRQLGGEQLPGTENNTPISKIKDQTQKRYAKDVSKFNEEITKSNKNSHSDIAEALTTVMHNIDRNFAKYPLMITVFGSSIQKIAESIGRDALANIYRNLERLQYGTTKEKDGDLDLIKLVDNLRIIFGEPNFIIDPNELLEHKFTVEQEIAITNNTANMFKPLMEKAITEKFSVFMENRQKFNEIFDVMNRILTKVWEGKENKGDLSNKEYKALLESLRQLMPALATFYGGDLETKLPFLKTQKGRVTGKNKQYSGNINLHGKNNLAQTVYNPESGKQEARKVKNDQTGKEEVVKPNTSTAHGTVTEITPMGLQAAIAAIHSSDAVVIYNLMASNLEMLGVHDAGFFGLNTATEGQQLMNKSLEEVMYNREIFDDALNSLKEAARFLEQEGQTKVADDILMRESTDLKGSFQTWVPGYKDENDEWIPGYNTNAFYTLAGYITHLESQNKKLEADRAFTAERINTTVNYGGEGQVSESSEQILKNQHKEPETKIDRLERKIDELDNKEKDLSVAEKSKQLVDKWTRGSSENITPNNWEGIPYAKLTASNVQALYGNLTHLSKHLVNQDSTEHKDFLQGMLTNVIQKVIHPIDLYITNKDDKVYGEISGDSKKVGLNIPKVTKQIAGIFMSPQTVYIHELLHGVTVEALKNNWTLYSEVRKVYKLVEASMSEQDIEKYKHIFRNSGTTTATKSNHLGETIPYGINDGVFEFVAFAGSEEGFRKILDGLDIKIGKLGERFSERTGKMEKTTLLQTIGNLINKILEFVGIKITKNKSTNAQARMDQLIKSLAEANYRQSTKLDKYKSFFQNIESATDKALVDWVVKPLTNLLDSKAITENKSETVQNLGNIARKIPLIPSHVSEFKVALFDVFYRRGWTDKHLVNSVVGEGFGVTKDIEPFADMMTKASKNGDQVTQATTQNTTSWLQEQMLSGEVGAETKTAITKVGVKGDVSSLVDGLYSWKDVVKLLKSKEVRAKEIDSIVAEMKKDWKQWDLYATRSRSLGSWMASGMHLEGVVPANNPDLIVDNHGTYKGQPEANTEQLRVLVTKLSRIYAIDYSSDENTKAFAEIMEKEYKLNGKDNGISAALGLHKIYKERYLSELLEGNKYLVMDGQIKEITDQHQQVVIADKKDSALLNRQEYVEKTGEFKPSSLIPKGVKLEISVSDVGGMIPYQNGIFQSTGLNKRSSDVLQGFTANDHTRQTMSKEFGSKEFKQAMLKQANKNRKGFDAKASPKQNGNLITVYGTEGQVLHFKAVLNEAQKDEYLKKNNHYDDVLGSMIGNVEDKKSTHEINKEMVQLLFDYQKEHWIRNPERFVTIGKNVKDKDKRDIYRKLPKETHKMIKDTFGIEEIHIPKMVFQMTFGNRKWSIASFIKPATEEEKAAHKMADMIGDSLAKKLNTRKVKLTENIWQGAVTGAKDTIVIKNPVVLYGNTASNYWINWMYGVSTRWQVKDTALSISATEKLLQDEKDKYSIELALEVNPNRKNAARLRTILKNINQDILRNPMNEMFIEGMSKTIIEDITNDEAMYTYKTKYQHLISPITDKIPQSAKDAANVVALGHETQPYQLLKDMTQMSDLSARFVLHQHNKRNKMPVKKSLRMIDETFVNYELPTHPGIQYGNDMGLVMFTKFFIRIQKVILATMGKAPARFFGLMWLNEFFDLVSIVQESFVTPGTVLNKAANPFAVMAQSVLHNPVIAGTGAI